MMVTVPSVSKWMAPISLPARGGDFEIAADAEAAQLAVLLAVALALLEAVIVGQLQRLLEHAEEIAAVVGHAGGGVEREIALADHVALAQFDAVDAELDCREIERALDIVIALGAAGAAIGRHMRGVGEHALGRHFDERRAVDGW